MASIENQIAEAIALLKAARYVVALTGAGISTPSGIPDFRTPDSGLWETEADPMAVASIYAFRHHPDRFYEWLYPLARLAMGAQPNAAHKALAALEAQGKLQSIITQNIDMLHSRAGSQTVYEVHGHLRQATCMQCHAKVDGRIMLSEFLHTRCLPRCAACGGVLKPDVILYGEVLPLHVLKRSQHQAMMCDMMIVAGSSLEVSPAGDLPWLAKQAGAKLLFINLSETHLDQIADLVIHADVVDVLPQLAAAFPVES